MFAYANLEMNFVKNISCPRAAKLLVGELTFLQRVKNGEIHLLV